MVEASVRDVQYHTVPVPLAIRLLNCVYPLSKKRAEGPISMARGGAHEGRGE